MTPMDNDLRAALLDVVAVAVVLRPSIIAQPRREATLVAHRDRLTRARLRMMGGELCEARRAGLDLAKACEEALACCDLDQDPLSALEAVARHTASVERLVPDHVPSSVADWTKNPIV